MAVSTIQGPGSVDGNITNVQSNDRAGYLIKFSGEVVNATKIKSEIAVNVSKKTVSDAKGFQWPLLGKSLTAPTVNNRGDDVGLTTFAQDFLTVQPDDRTAIGFYLDAQDEEMAHYEFRSQYVERLAEQFSLSEDTKVFSMLLQGARASARITGEAGGATIINANLKTDASAFEDAIMDAITTVKKNRYSNINEFSLHTNHDQVALLLKGSKVINKDFSGTAGVDMNIVPSMYGLKIMGSVNIETIQANYVDSTFGGRYSVDGTNMVALMAHKNRSVVGVQLGTMKFKKTENPTGFGSYWLMGLQTSYDYLMPDSIVELAIA